MRTKWIIIGIALLSAALAIGAVSCSDDNNDGDGAVATATEAMDETPMASEVGVALTEWQIIPDVESVAAGSVTFNAENIGQEVHELVIIKTDLAPDALPANDDGKVDEEGEGIEAIDEIEEFAAGGEESLTVDLEAGNYVLICNILTTEDDGTIESHYQLGMTVAFEVTG